MAEAASEDLPWKSGKYTEDAGSLGPPGWFVSLWRPRHWLWGRKKSGDVSVVAFPLRHFRRAFSAIPFPLRPFPTLKSVYSRAVIQRTQKSGPV